MEDEKSSHFMNAILRYYLKLHPFIRGAHEKTTYETISGWIRFSATLFTLLLARELRYQRILSSPPTVFVQPEQKNSSDRAAHRLLAILTGRRNVPPTFTLSKLYILSRVIKPSIFFTSSFAASIGAYFSRGPSDPRHECSFREYFRMGSDGSILALDWEIPLYFTQSTGASGMNISSIKHMLLHGPITLNVPIIIILHGMNNDSSYGYIRSLQRLCTDRGWITCAMNFRGCGTPKTYADQGVGLKSPRAYHAGYTNDLRTIVQCISHRCVTNGNHHLRNNGKKEESHITPIFLVGNSLGANIMTKYLGEEGIDQTLPPNVLAGISRGNPLEINGGKISYPWAQLLAMGVKKTLLLQKKNRQALTMMKDLHFQKTLWKAFFASSTIGSWDELMSPFMIRNEPISPFTNKIGFTGGEEYWNNSSSRNYVANVSVPLLILSSMDDFLVTKPALRSLNQCLANPNVVVVKTKAGGHLGWQEAPHDRYFGTSSFADAATVEFIAAVLQDNQEQECFGLINESRINESVLRSRL